MNQAIIKLQKKSLTCPKLPLAVYKEVAAHLQQVKGIKTELIPQTSTSFDYNQSQIGGLNIEYSSECDANCYQKVDEILAYYGEKFSPWQPFLN